VRSVFRIAEYITGYDGPLLKTEIYLYVFDGTLMFLVMAGFAVWHPSHIIAGKTKSRDELDLEVLETRDRRSYALK
jgi:hypothetical protein